MCRLYRAQHLPPALPAGSARTDGRPWKTAAWPAPALANKSQAPHLSRRLFVLHVPRAYTFKNFQAPAVGKNRLPTPGLANVLDWYACTMTAPIRFSWPRRILCVGRLCHPKHPVFAATFAVCVAGLAAICGVCVAQTPAPAVTSPKTASDDKSVELGKDWVRIRYDDKHKPLAMESAIVRYEPVARDPNASGPPVTVDLVGAVHIGDAAYYEGLNRRFDGYDALLYELVAPEGTVVERGRGTSNTHPLGALQNGMKAMLDLDHQLEKVDYTKKNFVHADMSPD